MSDHVSPVGYYSMARGNLIGASHIYRALPTEQERNINPCIQFLLGFTVEGYFKALLAHKNYKLHQLIAIGHNLKKAMQKAGDEGIALPGYPKLKFVVDNLALGHLKHHYRYLPSNPDGSDKEFTMVYPSLAFEALAPLDEIVFKEIQAEINADESRLGLPTTTNWPGAPML